MTAGVMTTPVHRSRRVPRHRVHGFYLRWIATNGVAEAIGLGTTFVAGWKLGPMLGDATEPGAIVGAAILAVVLGVALEGLVVGTAQESVLRRELPELRPWSWTTATAIGAGVAWVVGMVPSTIAALNASADATSPFAEPDAVTTYTLAAVLGVVAGPILGSAQWMVLRSVITGGTSWLWANALAWAVGMPLIFAGMDVVPWTSGAAAISLSVYALCGLTGLVVGSIHGAVMRSLLRKRSESSAKPEVP